MISQISWFCHVKKFILLFMLKGIKGWYWPQGLLSMPTDNSHKSWEIPSDKTSALPANPTSSRPRSWSLGNATLVVAERSRWRRVLSASKPRPSAKEAHPYRKQVYLEALRLATTKLTQRGISYPSWGHPTQPRISRGSTGLIHNIIWKLLQKKTKVFGFVGTDHLRTKIIINDEILEQLANLLT